MNYRNLPEGYGIVPKVVNEVLRFYIGHGLFYADNERLGEKRGEMYDFKPDFDGEKRPIWKNTWEEAVAWCKEHPR